MVWEKLGISNSPVSMIIIAVAFGLYAILIKLCFLSSAGQSWARSVAASMGSLKVLMTSLPLLGLLGTINGLMRTFSTLSINVAADLETLMASGISDAMITTQLGLAFVVPALTLQAFLNRRYRQYLTEV